MVPRPLPIQACQLPSDVSVHRAAASGRQAPGQGPWPGEPASGSYSFRRIMRAPREP